MPQEKEAAPPQIIGFRNRILKPAAAVLAIVLVLAAGTILTAKAFNIDISSKFAIWTSERFQFVDRTQETTASTGLELKSLQEALQHQNMTERLAPNWLPEGYVHKEVKIKNNPKMRVVHETLVKNDAELIIIIRKMISSPPMKVEKDDNLFEIYTVGGIDYYIFSNNETLQTKWCVGEFECTIAGSITLEEMKKMIDSI